MRCPFLREAQVKSCQASVYRKMILRTQGHVEGEKCSSPDYVTCPAAKQHHEELPDQSRCPFLQESLMQYCATAAVPKYIPYSESPFSRCGSSGFRYCELYLAMAHPGGSASEMEETRVDGIQVPKELYFSTNHMWLDISEEGFCHIGIDGILARVLGAVEKLTFLVMKGVQRPTAVLTVRGVDLQMVFPNPIQITGSNNYLRTNPEKLVSDPYTLGWLFEGSLPKHSQPASQDIRAGLFQGKQALAWMQQEHRRITEFVHEHVSRPAINGERFMMDGGGFSNDMISHLSREEILHLFNEFFSPYASQRR